MSSPPPQPTLEITLEQMLAAQEKTVNEISERMQDVHGPGWDARHDYSKTLIAISSAIFAAVVTFSDQVFADSGQKARLFVVLALALFVLSIGFSLWTIYQRVGLMGFRARYLNQRNEIRSLSHDVDLSKSDAHDHLMAIFKGAVDVAVEPIGRSDKVAHRCAIASGFAFFLALISFLLAIVIRYI